MFPVSPVSSKFNCLPQRPPTPPRDLAVDVDDALRFLQNGHDENVPETPQPNAEVPEKPVELQSPVQTQPTEPVTTSKRVGFLTQPIYHPSPDSSIARTPDAFSPHRIPRSRSDKPLKSILKQSLGHPPPSPADLDTLLNCFSPQEPGSFRKMLNSALQHLAQSSRSARLDAYLALNGALKTYDGIPEPDTILDKSSLLLQFISRDVAWKDSTGRLDRDIVTQALYLVNAIMFNSRTAPALDEEFKTFILDRSIMVLEQPDIPKGVIKGHLVLLCHSRLYAGIINASRTEKLLAALQTITDRCSGNSIIGARLIAYHRLLEQSPMTMLSKMRDWLEHTFHGLLSSNKEFRARALEACTAAGLILGTHPHAAKALDELFGRTSDDTSGVDTYGDFVVQKLRQMITDPDSATYVPQVWAAVVMLLRSKRRPLDRWSYFRKWLETLQQCLNSSDILVRQQSLIAWNKLTFSAMPDSSHTESFRSMLKLPIVVGLKVRGRDKRSQQQRTLAMDSYCNLLHYAMRPGLADEDLDKAWDLYVDDVLSSMAQSSSKGQQYACSVLQGLFQKKEGTWNANAANETHAIKPNELPRLDPKWLRNRFGRVLRLIETLTKMALISPDAPYAAMQSSWQSLLLAVAEAGSQEVRISGEMKDVIAQLLNTLRRVWRVSASLDSTIDPSMWLGRYQALVRTAFETLGSGHLSQDFLLVSSNDEVEATPTPSNRVSKHPAPSESAIMYLFALYCQPSDVICRNERFSYSISDFLSMVSTTKTSTPGALALLQKLLQFGVRTTSMVETPTTHALIWTAIAARTTEVLKVQTLATPTRERLDTGASLRAALHIMQHGMSFSDSSPAYFDTMTSLYTAMCRSAVQLGGAGCLAIGVMEPVAKFALDICDDLPTDNVTHLARTLLLEAKWPKNRQALEEGRKALRGHSLDSHANPTFEPFDFTYSFLQAALMRLYSDAANTTASSGLLSAYSEFLKSCPVALLAKVLTRTQAGLTMLLEDQQCHFSNQTGGIDGAEAVLDQCKVILHLIPTIPRKDSLLLKSIEPLFVGALSSTNRAVANEAINLWNDTFGRETSLTYPPKLEAVLHARSRETEIALPGFREDTHNIPDVEFPVFQEVQDDRVDFSVLPPSAMTSRLTALLLHPEQENVLIRQHLAQKLMGPHGTDRPSPTRNMSSNPVPRLRHDDSQIEFAPIAPSPQHSDDDSQSLTDHQMEVYSRQLQDAQIYPTMSSSPAPSPRKGMPKRLDLVAQSLRMQNPESLATPDGLVDGNPMSDDLPSSPTPRATNRKFVDADLGNEDNQDDSMSEDELTSSPPRRSEEARPEYDIDSAALADIAGEAMAVEDHINSSSNTSESAEDDTTLLTPQQEQWTDLPSDTYLPSAQLLREAAAAKTTVEVADTSVEAEEPAAAQSLHDKRVHVDTAVPVSQDEPPEHSESHANSIIATSDPSDMDVEAQQSQISEMEEQKDLDHIEPRATRKRKRASGTVYTARKRKPQSPLKKLFSNFFGQSQEDADEDIGEEIVVASSQTPANHLSDAVQSDLHTSEQETKERETDPTSESVTSVPATQVRRGRGRPRRSLEALPTSTPASRLKRSASVAGLDEAEESGTSRSRKLRGSQEQMRVEDSQPSQDTQRSTRITRQSFATTRGGATPESQVESAGDEQQDSQSSVTSTAVNPGRKIAQPTSILGRLRGILADCRNMIMGSQEEREIDSVLFEMRREVFEAGRRGRTA